MAATSKKAVLIMDDEPQTSCRTARPIPQPIGIPRLASTAPNYDGVGNPLTSSVAPEARSREALDFDPLRGSTLGLTGSQVAWNPPARTLEPSFRSSLLEGLADYRGELEALVAPHGAAALEALRARKIDLPVANLRLPVMDGFGLLEARSALGERIPAIVAEHGANPLFPSAKRGGKNHE